MTDIAIELSTVCAVAGWTDAAPYAQRETCTLKPDGRVVLLHADAEVEIGTVTADQYARLALDR